MTEEAFTKLQADEAAAYAEYTKANDILRKCGDRWLPLKQALDRETLRRQMLEEIQTQEQRLKIEEQQLRNELLGVKIANQEEESNAAC